MKFYTFIVSLTLVLNSVWADTNAINHYKTLTVLDGDWILSPADAQEGGATKKGQAAKLIDTDMTAITSKLPTPFTVMASTRRTQSITLIANSSDDCCDSS